ncbi:MAG: EamA family transporter [Bacteroidia bacterium]
MKIPNWLLFSITCFIWGTTWYAIKYQIVDISPTLSIAYRFGIASVLLFIYLILTKAKLRFSALQHKWFFIQGVLLFGICYWLTYWAETGLTSGLVAVLSSLIIFFNVILGRFLLKREIKPKLLFGFLLGIVGMSLLYKDEIGANAAIANGTFLLIIAVLANLAASLGNIVSMRNQTHGLPITQTNAYGMAYSSIIMFVFSIAKGDEIIFINTFSYTASLLYLSVFGSIIAFYCYLTLLGKLGPGKAAYTNLVIPIVALIVSTLFESFEWSINAFIGLALVLAGNYVALKSKG